jgi:hypothetical protein
MALAKMIFGEPVFRAKILSTVAAMKIIGILSDERFRAKRAALYILIYICRIQSCATVAAKNESFAIILSTACAFNQD